MPGGVRVFSRCSSGKGRPGPGISHCIPVTSFGSLYRLESLQHHQKKCFCDFPITLISSSMSCSQAMAKLSGQKPASIRALKCLWHVLSHGESLENGKQDVKDLEDTREGVSMGPAHTGQGAIVETPHVPESRLV